MFLPFICFPTESTQWQEHSVLKTSRFHLHGVITDEKYRTCGKHICQELFKMYQQLHV